VKKSLLAALALLATLPAGGGALPPAGPGGQAYRL